MVRIKERFKTMFGYNAVEDKSRRKPPSKRTKHESKVLTAKKRKKLQATAQEQIRNHSLVAWMVRKHLDYVSTFRFSFRTGKTAVDNLVNRIFHWHGSPRNLDIAKRLGRDEMFRLFELEKVVSGDAGFIKLAQLKLQGLESDLIARGSDYTGTEKINEQGLVVNPSTGERLKFSIANRGNGAQIIHDHIEDADSVIFDGYWSRFTSQFRGISPLTTAINTVQDVHEAFEYNLIKAKMHALFGVAVMRDALDEDDIGGAAGATAETANATATAAETELDLNPRTINMLDLNKDDTIEMIESKTPSTEFVAGSYLFIQIAMLALDIPITSFDSRRSSFSARIADLNEYQVSAEGKRTKNRHVREEYSDWVIDTIWNTPNSPWPLRAVAESAGMNLMDVKQSVEWIPSGAPWLDKLKQVKGDELAMKLRLDNPIDASRRRGVDVFKNIDKAIQVEVYERDEREAAKLPPAQPLITEPAEPIDTEEMQDAMREVASEDQE